MTTQHILEELEDAAYELHRQIITADEHVAHAGPAAIETRAALREALSLLCKACDAVTKACRAGEELG